MKTITDTVARLCIDANRYLCPDIKAALEKGLKEESSPRARDVFSKLLENAEIAKTEGISMCQDTGMAVVFVKLGREVYIDGRLEDAINDGVREGYGSGFLRKSVVCDPLKRINTGDNAPAVIHLELTEGDKIEITVAPKGFGSENMSAVKMLKPSDGEKGVLDFIVETVKSGGGNPCPPVVVGVGIGGTMEKAAYLSKKALLIPVDNKNDDEYYASLEAELLKRINALGIGPMGWGGNTTALGVNILTYPTHIAGLPVAVNIGCHATRHASAII
ncbi:MAG: L(+)-tartrate dehydratase subunit alpha [Firmicutes bacterium ADurb.Bin193]|nr:MAG: L(+)-tartrate dehydratase subunit alpha [Firmicutes bacterium ADurb.Bin193]